jgi:hypothetical protein
MLTDRKYIKKKIELLNRMGKIKIDSNLYHSHLSVIIKEYLEGIREFNSEIEWKNTQTAKDLQDY